jgi:hypothetical protein
MPKLSKGTRRTAIPSLSLPLVQQAWGAFFQSLGVITHPHAPVLVHGQRISPTWYVPAWHSAVLLHPYRRQERQYDSVRVQATLLVQQERTPVLLIIGTPWPGEYAVQFCLPTVEAGTRLPARAALVRSKGLCVFGYDDTHGMALVYAPLEARIANRSFDREAVRVVPLNGRYTVENNALEWIPDDTTLPDAATIEPSHLYVMFKYVPEATMRQRANPLAEAYLQSRMVLNRAVHGPAGPQTWTATSTAPAIARCPTLAAFIRNDLARQSNLLAAVVRERRMDLSKPRVAQLTAAALAVAAHEEWMQLEAETAQDRLSDDDRILRDWVQEQGGLQACERTLAQLGDSRTLAADMTAIRQSGLDQWIAVLR